jgi:small subunit ribosomal protein S21
LAEVRLQEGESLENALRRFKRKVQTEDIIKEVKRHSFYLKPGERKRVKEALARKRSRKKARKSRTKQLRAVRAGGRPVPEKGYRSS